VEVHRVLRIRGLHIFLESQLRDGGDDLSQQHRLPRDPRKIPGTHFCQRRSTPQCHNAAARIRSVDKCNDLINKQNKLLGLSPQLVGEASANFCGERVPRGQRDGSLRPYSRFSRQEPLLFYQAAPQLYSRG
jgi:hypothetical protein